MKRTQKVQGYLPPPSGVSKEHRLLTEAEAAAARAHDGIPTVESCPPPERQVKKHRGFGVACAVMLLGVALTVIPSLWYLLRQMEGGFSWSTLGRNMGVGFLSLGLPSVNEPFFSVSMGTAEEAETDPPSPTETDREVHTEATPETETVGDPVTEGTETVLGWPIVYADMSAWEQGAEQVTSDGICEVPEAPSQPPSLSGKAVLIVHSHPYATYGDGGDMVTSDADGWAVEVPTDGGYPAKGVVTLGQRLSILLRLRGIQVIHALVPSENVPSHMNTYEKTDELVKHMCAEHPEIGLIIDLRRGADKLPDGSLLRTMGTYEGKTVGQVRVVVDALRSDDCAPRDLATAVALRRLMYEVSPTLSRPVYVTGGEGLRTEGKQIFLTLEFGTAGNTFEEAAAVLVPVADALAGLMSANAVSHIG